MIYCQNIECSSYTDSPLHLGWLLVKETTQYLDTTEKAFCCWKCLGMYAFDQRPVL